MIAPRDGWSLRARMLKLLVLLTIGIVLLPSILAAWFIQRSIDREVAALTIEELTEMQMHFASSERTPEAVTAIAAKLQEEHPGNSMAWRFWDLETREVWGDFGRSSLFADLELRSEPRRTTLEPAPALRWRVDDIDDDYRIGLLIDSKAQLDLLARYHWIVALASGACALFAGALFSQRVSDMLSNVARSVRDRDRPEIAPERAPDEIREVADAFEETLERIRHETERSQLLTAGLAHELRSPIQVLLGESEVALMRERSNERYRELLESHRDELRELARAVDNLVTLCARDENRSSATLEIFDLAEEAKLRFEREVQRARRQEVELELHLDGPQPIRGDREALLLVLSNVVTNAIQWSPRGAKVEARLEGDPQEISFTVEDLGPGIPPQERERIFEPFYRGPAARGRRTGFGLGLALTLTAIQEHGGEIRIEDRPDGRRGTHIQVILPRKLDSFSPLDPAPAGNGRAQDAA